MNGWYLITIDTHEDDKNITVRMSLEAKDAQTMYDFEEAANKAAGGKLVRIERTAQ